MLKVSAACEKRRSVSAHSPGPLSGENLPPVMRIHPSGHALYCTLAVVIINRTIVSHKSVRETYSDDGIWMRVDAVNDEFNSSCWLGELENRCLPLISYSLGHAACSGKHDAVVLSLVSSPIEMPASERVNLRTIPEMHALLLIVDT